MRLGQLGRQDVRAPIPEVVGGELQVAREQVAELAELLQRLEQAAAQSVDVRSPERRGHEVDVALGHERARTGNPLQGPVHGLLAAFGAVYEWLRQDRIFGRQGTFQILRKPGLI